MSNAIGYDFNDGGINNQKLALLGLVVVSHEQNKPLYLPKIYSKDQSDAASSLHPFEEIFDDRIFHSFLSRWNIERVPFIERSYDDRIARGGWKFFDAGAWHLSASQNPASSGLVADFFRSLTPLITRTSEFTRLCTSIFDVENITIVNQLRIEEDWRIHCQYNLDPTIHDPEDYNITASEIVLKTRDTLSTSKIFASCDERYIHISRSDLAKEILDQTGVQVLFKSDFLESTITQKMRPIDTSLLDFELAKVARKFVGMSRSTFANLATFERYCMRYSDLGDDFIYNVIGKKLGRRTDLGRKVNPLEVIA